MRHLSNILGWNLICPLFCNYSHLWNSSAPFETHRSDQNGQNKKDLQKKHLNTYGQELQYINMHVHILWAMLFPLACVWLTWGTKLPWWQQGERSMLGGDEAPGSVQGSAEAAFGSNVLINDIFCHPYHCQTRWRCSWSEASLRYL